MATGQLQTTNVTPQTAAIGGVSTTVLVDLVQLFSAQLAANIVRQVMVLGDPVNVANLAAISNNQTRGDEMALLVRLASGSSDLLDVVKELRNIRAELQLMNINFGVSLPATPLVLQEGQQAF
jgi:hypothetical protein